MPSFGRQVLGNVGTSIQLSADGKPEMKTAGITFDWSTVTAHSGADLTLEDGVVIVDGEKYVRYGTPVVLIGVAEVQTITFTGGPTAGDAIITLPASATEDAQTADAVAFNASAAVVAAALNALSRIASAGVATVTRTGAGSNADPYIYTITLPRSMGNVAQLTSTHTFTGGTTPTTTHATTTSGSTGGGKYGPADTSASDGRQTLERGHVFLVNETVKQADLHSDHPPVLEGGKVWKSRLLVGGTNQVTLTNLLTAMPRLLFAED